MDMMELNRGLTALFMISAAWQDLKSRTISIWLYGIFGALLFVSGCFSGALGAAGPWDRLGSMGIGGILLLISRLSRGAVGEGDGWFLMTTGLALGFWSNLALLLYGLLFCSSFCLGLVAWGAVLQVRVGRKTVPFLPFLLPAGLWMVLL